MPRLLVHVEGHTEESFVNQILAPHLSKYGYMSIGARLLGNARQRDHRGGIRGWNTVRREILRHLKENAGCKATTMVDYYGLPQSGQEAWPGRSEASNLAFINKAVAVQDALLKDVEKEMGSDFDSRRFIPYVVMHEFEGLLFSDCDRFGNGIGRLDLIKQFKDIRAKFNDHPEEINDSPDTAPSKRVEKLMPGYQKPLFGILAAQKIGLESIRAVCPNFRDWLERLEATGQAIA